MRLDLLVTHIDYLHNMCRVRFGLTGIYLDSLEPSRPREEFFQPLIVSVPPVLHNKHGDAGPEAMNGGEIQEKVIVTTEIPNDNQDCTTKNLSYSSSSSRDDGCRFTKKVKTTHASVGSKRIRNSVSSSSSPVSTSSVSPPPSSDEDWIHDLKTNKRAPQRSKLIDLRKTPKGCRNLSKSYTSLSPEGPTKAPPPKRVRFAMDKHKCITPNLGVGSTSSSDSSDDSYTDPPSPIEPCDPFRGYYRTPTASNLYDTNGQGAKWGTQVAAGVATGMNEFDDFLDSEDGSEVDVQALPVKRCPQRTMRADVGGPKSNQWHHQSKTAPTARSKQSGRVIEQPCVVAQNDESNFDNGLHFEESHANRRESVLRPQSHEQLRYPKLRSGKDLPEPIFVVRPRVLSTAKGKGKPAGIIDGVRYSGDISKNRQEGTKGPPAGLTVAKAPNKHKSPKYRPPSVTDDLKRDVNSDVGLDMLVRDV